ncbi:MAG: hypothetical protein EOP33_09235 [Rickettsiaceae bacterium]|nr:MAG: hypothetical protein EOP33_09235 [Rickettsiaceae bacterium]
MKNDVFRTFQEKTDQISSSLVGERQLCIILRFYSYI